MVQINFAKSEVQCKVVYYGPAQSGKTANLAAVRTRMPDSATGTLTTIATDTHRTLFFDFLPLNLGRVAGINTKIHLYGVPWQENQNAVRVLVLEGVDGIVFVADRERSKLKENVEAMDNLVQNLSGLGRDLADIPMVFQWNKTDATDALSETELREHLNPNELEEFPSVASTGEGVLPTLKAITQKVLIDVTRVTRAAAAAAPPPVGHTREPLPEAEEEESGEEPATQPEELAATEEGREPAGLFPRWRAREPDTSTDREQLFIQPVAAPSTDITESTAKGERFNPLDPHATGRKTAPVARQVGEQQRARSAEPAEPRSPMDETATDLHTRLVKVRAPTSAKRMPDDSATGEASPDWDHSPRHDDDDWLPPEGPGAESSRRVRRRAHTNQNPQSIPMANLVAGAVFTILSLAAIGYVVMKLL